MNSYGTGKSRRGSHARNSMAGSQLNDFSGLGTGSGTGRGSRKHSRRSSSVDYRRPSIASNEPTGLNKPVATLPGSNGEMLLTRRHLLYGALGVGVVAAAGVGVKAIADNKEESSEIATLEVPEDMVTDSSSLDEVENEGQMALIADLSLPYGTLIWANSEEYAALLLPTDSGSPLTQVGLLRLSSGYYYTVMEQAVGHSEGFEVYDVRASDRGMVWTEVDIMEGIWRIYTAMLDDGQMGTPLMVDEGTDDWETPSIAICGTNVFWQILPQSDGAMASEQSTIKKVSLGGTGGQVVMTSNGRFCTPLYAMEDAIVATPRVDADSVYYQLTLMRASDCSIQDTMVLPASMKPLEAGYGETGFMFSFEGIYSYGDGIANLGTYAPMTDTRGADPSNTPWFHFSRTPSAPPCWCGDYLVIKSSKSVCCVDLEEKNYFLFDVQSGADDYGDYLASTGNCSRIVTFSNVNDKPVDGDATQYCYVRVWEAL